MKILKKFVLIMVLTFSFTNMIKAECDDKTISNLKLQASNIEINYEHVDDLYSEDFDLKIVNLFDVHVIGLTSDMYILVEHDSIVDTYEYSNVVDGILNINKIDGGQSLKIIVYSTECNEKLKTFNISIPYYNSYYDSEQCAKYPDANVCNEFYEYEMTYENFDKGINDYINKLNNNNEKDNQNNNLFSDILNFIIKNILYIIISLIVIAGTIVAIIVHKKRRELS